MQKAIAEYISKHPELTNEKEMFKIGYDSGYNTSKKIIDSLREGLLLMSLEVYAQGLQRSNLGIRKIMNDVLKILEETKDA
jgi:hypothetical protein